MNRAHSSSERRDYMRILIFSSTYAPHIGGVETVTRRLATELVRQGHEVSVYTNRYPRSLSPHETLDGISVRRRIYPNILPSPGRRTPLTVAKQVLSIPLALRELIHLWRRLGCVKPDVVNIHYFSYPAAYALIASRLRGLSVVLCFHGSDVASCPYPASYRWTMPWACSMAHIVIACSQNLLEYLQRDLNQAARGRTRVSHYGIDPVSKPADSARGHGKEAATIPETFVFLPSRLVEKKNVSVAITAVSILKRRGSPVNLVIAGDGPLRQRLEALVRDVDATDRVTFLGSVDHETSLDLMHRAAFIVVPSSWEAFGQVCLEAMAAGKAVVGCDNGGISEIVQHGQTGLLVPPDDPETLAGAIAVLAGDPPTATAMGSAGRLRVADQFTWAQMVSRYEQAFEDAQSPVKAHGWSFSG